MTALSALTTSATIVGTDLVYFLDGANSRAMTFTNFVGGIETLGMSTAGITSGTFADARIAESNVTQHEAALAITESQISDLGSYLETVATTDLDSPTGSDTNIVTGTKPAGAALNIASWNVDGDLVDSGLELANVAENLGLQTIWVPAVAMVAPATSGATAATLVVTGHEVATFQFGNSADSYTHFSIRMPKSWDLGSLQFQVHVATETGDVTNNEVEFYLAAGAVGNDESLNSLTFGTPVVDGGDASGILNMVTSDDLYITDVSGNVTVGSTPADGNLILFELYRDVDVGGAGNPLAAAVELLGITILYTVDAGTDD